MNKLGVLTCAVSVVFLLTLASSVQADPVNSPRAVGLEKLANVESFGFELLSDTSRTGGLLLAEHFADNNGRHLGFANQLDFANQNSKHLGFSVAAFHGGMKFGLINRNQPPAATTVTQNPEPTGMLLLGTGLAAGAAFLRKVNRKRKL